MLLLRVMTHVVLYKLFWNWIGVTVCDLFLKRFDLTKYLLFDTFFIDVLNK